MEKVKDLNYILHLYIGNAKIARVPCNFLMDRSVGYILHHFYKDFYKSRTDSQFFTSFEIEYQGNIIYREIIPVSSDIWEI
jgi:hypothetical protein